MTNYTKEIYSIKSIVLWSIAAVLMACGNTKSTTSNSDCIEANVLVKTEQSSVSGAQSNLRSTKTYIVEFQANVADGTEILSLLVDSIRIPIRSISLDGEPLANNEYYLHGSFESIKVKARRFFYDENFPQKIVEQETYHSSGQYVPKGEAWLEYSCVGELKFLQLGALYKLKTELHP